jgi:hypothetical protein
MIGNSQPVPQVVLLHVLLSQALQIPLGEGDIGGEVDLGLGPLQGQICPEVARLNGNLHLDALHEILLKVGAVHDAVLDGVGAVDDELAVLLAQLLDALALALEGLLPGLLGGLGCDWHPAPATISFFLEVNQAILAWSF